MVERMDPLDRYKVSVWADEKTNKVQWYIIEVHSSGGLIFCLRDRYSSIAEWHASIPKIVKKENLPKMPPKVWFSSDKMVQKRAHDLELFFNQIFNRKYFPASLLIDYFRSKTNDQQAIDALELEIGLVTKATDNKDSYYDFNPDDLDDIGDLIPIDAINSKQKKPQKNHDKRKGDLNQLLNSNVDLRLTADQIMKQFLEDPNDDVLRTSRHTEQQLSSHYSKHENQMFSSYRQSLPATSEHIYGGVEPQDLLEYQH